MKKDLLKKQLADILPDRPFTPNLELLSQEQIIDKGATRLKEEQAAKELAKIKFREKQRLRYLEQKQEKHRALAQELGMGFIPDSQTENQARQLRAQQEKIETIEAIEETVQPLHPVELAEASPSRKTYSSTITKALQMQGTTRPEVLKLLASLNINLSVQLSKSDTANLLACLLTCNEAQLAALYNNKKVPVVIKTVIKRLQEDAKLGNIDTVERLWDRVFGKNAMTLDLPERAQIDTGIIPNTPISREAYIVIRDSLIR